eukprot:TRINITY_DN6759_c0_g2_i1.p2 TRINITY_DN6759_c0_g2~~TRINITY_DN6759_c0_g2_i1.p2  ORF type:complete len:276 (-),score=29.31 TRINITY_DN6759_c0_g2_i1:363-1190(-)
MTTYRSFDAVLVDLDDTLYQVPQMTSQMFDKIKEYMTVKLGIQDAEKVARDLYLQHGTTVAGLVAEGYPIDMHEWHAFTHWQLPYNSYIHPSPQIQRILQQIDVPKFIFTNADRKHTQFCLKRLQLEREFQGVICFESIQEMALLEGVIQEGERRLICKPSKEAVRLALKQAGINDPARCIFFDDSRRNIATAKEVGIFSVLVSESTTDAKYDFAIPSLEHIPIVLPQLLTNKNTLQQLEDCSERDKVVVMQTEAIYFESEFYPLQTEEASVQYE